MRKSIQECQKIVANKRDKDYLTELHGNDLQIAIDEAMQLYASQRSEPAGAEEILAKTLKAHTGKDIGDSYNICGGTTLTQLIVKAMKEFASQSPAQKSNDELLSILLDVSNLQIDVETAKKKIVKMFQSNPSQPADKSAEEVKPDNYFYVLNNFLDDTDEFLMHLEDFTHGRDGDNVTELRHRIKKIKKSSIPNNTLNSAELLAWVEDEMSYKYISDNDRIVLETVRDKINELTGRR